MPGGSADLARATEASTKPGGLAHQTETAILHRTPWRPPTAVKAHGIYIELDDGKELIDAVGGAAVACLGSGNTKVANAITDQLSNFSYVYSCQLTHPPAEALAHRLIATAPEAFEQVIFLSGGSEAMEAAIKLARQYWYEVGKPERRFFIARELSYHGNTLGALALCHHPGRRAPYEAILEQNAFQHVSPVYYKRFAQNGESVEAYVKRLADELEEKIKALGPENVAAFAAEPVVGATQGVTYAPPGYFAAVSAVCKKYDILLIWDEVMCGMGRMGKTFHAWQGPNSYTDGVAPDIQAVAKGLGAGYASIGAVLFNKRVADGIRNGSNWLQHGHTYQAHPLACAASMAVQDVIEEDKLLDRCFDRGTYLGRLLKEELTGPNAIASPYVFDVRGGGLFWAVEFEFKDEVSNKWFKPARFGGRVQAKAMELGIVIIGMSGGVDGSRGDHIILSPAYTITDQEVEEIVRRTVRAVNEVLQETVLSTIS